MNPKRRGSPKERTTPLLRRKARFRAAAPLPLACRLSGTPTRARSLLHLHFVPERAVLAVALQQALCAGRGGSRKPRGAARTWSAASTSGEAYRVDTLRCSTAASGGASWPIAAHRVDTLRQGAGGASRGAAAGSWRCCCWRGIRAARAWLCPCRCGCGASGCGQRSAQRSRCIRRYQLRVILRRSAAPCRRAAGSAPLWRSLSSC